MGLKVWLPMLGNLENQGTLVGNIENMGAVAANTSGKIGQCMSFTGTGTSNVRLPPVLKNTDDCTIAYWVKFNSTANSCLYSQRVAANTAGFTIFFLNGNSIRFDDGADLTATSTISTGTWYHIVCCRDASKKYIYINGVLKASGNRTNTAASNVNSNYAFIGGSQNNAAGTPVQTNANMLNGYLNDYRIYDHCLSAAEVREISQGLVLHYKLDSLNNNLFKLVPQGYHPTDYCGYNLGLETNLVGGQKYTVQLWDVTISHSGKTNTQLNLQLYWGGGNNWLVTFVNSNFTNGHADYLKATFTAPASPTNATEAQNTWINVYNSPSYVSGTLNMHIGAWKIEKGNIGTLWSGNDNMIIDSSGYGHNGTIIGNLTLNNNTARYSASTYIASGNTSYITTQNEIGNFSNGITTSIWFKSSCQTPGNDYHEIFNIATTTQNFEHAIHKSGYFRGGMVINGTRYVDNTNNTNITDGNWHHIAMTYDGAVLRRYVDGVDKKDTTISGTLTSTSCKFLFGHYGTNTSYYAKEAYLSDARIYCTALSAADVKSLYEVGARVDNKGSLHTYEFNENGSNKLKKTGVFYNYATEPYIQLSDGSCWKLMLFHYVDNGNNLFTSSNASYNDGFGLYSRLKDIDNFTYNNKYEFYVIQDGVECRWTQTNAPMTTTSVAGFTAVSGTPGGGICKCNGNTLLAATNSTGNWWRACGCWTKYNGGIPGFGSSVVCKQYLALYARIDKITYKTATGVNYANNLIEF